MWYVIAANHSLTLPTTLGRSTLHSALGGLAAKLTLKDKQPFL